MNEKVQNLRQLIDGFENLGDKTALIAFGTDDKRQLSFADLYRSIRHLSAGLLRSGLKQQEIVILLAANSPELVIAILSIIYAGGVCLVVDPQSDDKILEHIVKDSEAKRIFLDSKNLERWQNSHLKTKDIHIIRLDDEKNSNSWQKLCSEDIAESQPIKGDDTAVLFYTSGTTGMPKGVPLSHTNLIFQLDAVLKSKLLNNDDRMLLPLPLFHVYPFVIGLLVPFSLALTVVLPKSITGPEIIRAIKEGEASVLIAVPRLLRALYTAIETKARSNNISRSAFDNAHYLSDFLCTYFGLNIGKLLFKKLHKQFPKLRLLSCGGALLEPRLARNLIALGWQTTIGYGLTETSPLLTIRMPENRDLESIGKPIPGIAIRLQKIDSAEPGEEKQTEIQAQGPSIFTGYRNLPDKTAETFTKDGWFKTGDIGYFHQGNLHISGRISTTIKSEGGKKIQPDEIEKAYENEPAIREIGILENKQKLVALVVPNLKSIGQDNIRDKIGQIIKQKSATMPSYYRITDFAISRELLPRTNLGKFRRQELIQRYEKAKAAEKNDNSQSEDDKSELSSEDKSLLNNPVGKSCWDWLEERFPESKLTLDKSPQLDLNIDSLEWINLTLEMRERLGVEINEEAIARVDTLRDLLKEVIDASQSGTHAISPFEQPDLFIDEDQKEWLKPLGPTMAKLAKILYWSNKFVMRSFFKVSSQGLKYVPNDQVIFTPNHSSYIDAFAISAILDLQRMQRSQWAGWAGIALANPFNAFIYKLAQAVPIEAKQSLISSLALVMLVLKNRRSLIWFPEGERTLTGDVLPFKGGIGMILEHFSVPVIPVFIDGAREALPPGAFFPNFNKITVIFGKPVLAEELDKEGKGDTKAERIAEALRQRVIQLKP